jgi:predicted transcriptional regulator
MKHPRLSKLELKLMEVLWARGTSSIREIQAALPAKARPAISTLQTLIYRLEAKGAVRRVSKIANAYTFDAAVSRHAAHSRLIDDFLEMFGGLIQPVMIHLVEKGKLTLEDVQDAETLLRDAAKKGKAK